MSLMVSVIWVSVLSPMSRAFTVIISPLGNTIGMEM